MEAKPFPSLRVSGCAQADWDANLSIGSRGRGLPGRHGVRAHAKGAAVYAALSLKFYSSMGGGIGEFSRKVRRKIPKAATNNPNNNITATVF
jgi:hypothetical protein